MKLRNLALIGYYLMIFSFIFGFCETIYFGCNLYPKSKAELICDNISISICSLGCFIFIFSIIKKIINN